MNVLNYYFQFLTTVSIFISINKACTDEFKKYRDCVGKFREKQDAGLHAEIEEYKKRATECFTKNKCEKPSFENAEEKSAKEKDKRKECRSQLKVKVREMVTKCTEDKLGFRLPDQSDKNKRENAHEKSTNLIKQAKLRCPNNKTLDNVFDCLRNVHNETANEEDARLQTTENRLREFCSKKSECFSKSLTEKCQKSFNDTSNIACECTKSLIQSKSDEFNREYFDCLQTTPPPGKPNPSYFVDNLVDAYCNSVIDLCRKEDQEQRDAKRGSDVAN